MKALPDEWRTFFDAHGRAGLIRPVIVESWKRSKVAHVAQSASPVMFSRVSTDELEARKAKRSRLIELVRPHIEWLCAHLSSITHVAYLADEDGVVLFSLGDDNLRQQLGLEPGFHWAESVMGTNGAGTAIVEGCAVGVFGEEHYIEAFRGCTCTAAPIRAADGKIIGAIDVSSAAQDATPERLSLVSHIAHVVEQELKLDQRRLEAEGESSDKESLLAVLAHELRGPISTIRTTSEALKTVGHGNENLLRLAGTIDRQSNLLTMLIRDLLEMARVKSGRVKMNKVMVDLSDCIATAVEAHQAEIKAKNQKVEVQAAGCGAVYADQTRLIEMLSNLVSNASRYSPAEGRIIIVGTQQHGKFTVSVKDSGRGFEPTTAARLFEPFVSGKESRSRSDSLGIGLWLTRHFAELHGGCVTAHSEGIGKGAEFRLELPAV